MTNGERIKLWASGAYKVVILFLYVIGVIGGMGNLFYFSEYACALGVAVAGVLGSKKALELLREVINGD